jgi:hypothetical protein
MAGLAILRHMHDLSDEVLCERWISVYPATNVEATVGGGTVTASNPQRGAQSDFSARKAS